MRKQLVLTWPLFTTLEAWDCYYVSTKDPKEKCNYICFF